MAKFKVKALFAFVGKKRYNSGDILDGSSLGKGVAEDLVKRNFIVEITDDAPASDAGKNDPPPPPADGGDGAGDLTVSRGTGGDQTGGADQTGTQAGAGDDKGNQAGDDDAGDDDDAKGGEGIDSISLKRLRKELRARGVKFSNETTKEELFAMYQLKQ